MKKLFFALWPSDETRKQIAKFNLASKSEALKYVKPGNLHVTLVFLGNVDAESEVMLRQNAENITFKPFVLYFDQLVFWQKPRILCLSMQHYDQQLILLVDALKNTVEECGIKTEKRPYIPHITVARKASEPINIEVKAFEWLVESFCIVESSSTLNGVQYQVLQRWNIKE